MEVPGIRGGRGPNGEARQEIGSRKTEMATATNSLESLARRRDEASRRLERVTSETDMHNERTKELDRESKRVDSALAVLEVARDRMKPL